jgi:2-haloacid dehalogenase
MSQSAPVIIFDFGGVLLDWNPLHVFTPMLQDEAEARRFMQEIDFAEWNRMLDGGRPFAEGVADWCARFPRYCQLIRAFHTRWAESIGGPMDGTIAILDDLRQEGYRLFGLSNWSAETFPLMRSQYPFFGWFEQIILSGEVRLTKPDPRIFDLTVERIGRPAGECVLIDDSLTNVEAARRAGMQALHFIGPEQLRADLTGLGIYLNGIRKGRA